MSHYHIESTYHQPDLLNPCCRAGDHDCTESSYSRTAAFTPQHRHFLYDRPCHFPSDIYHHIAGYYSSSASLRVTSLAMASLATLAQVLLVRSAGLGVVVRCPLLLYSCPASDAIGNPVHVAALVYQEGAQSFARLATLIEYSRIVTDPLFSIVETSDDNADFFATPCRLGAEIVGAGELSHNISFILIVGLAVLSLFVESDMVDLATHSVDDSLMQPREHEGCSRLNCGVEGGVLSAGHHEGFWVGSGRVSW